MTTIKNLFGHAIHPELHDNPEHIISRHAGQALAILRIATSAVFLWAFLDKLLGLNYSTPHAKAWIHGGSPTKGFLASVNVGPFQHLFHHIAGQGWADTLFMLALLGIGLALLTGIALRPAALAGVALLAMMWAAEWPLAQHTTTGTASGSTNPLIDYHILYALTLIVLATTYAGNTWGLGRLWARIPYINKHRWAL